jgi:hypothetical protein
MSEASSRAPSRLTVTLRRQMKTTVRVMKDAAMKKREWVMKSLVRRNWHLKMREITAVKEMMTTIMTSHLFKIAPIEVVLANEGTTCRHRRVSKP